VKDQLKIVGIESNNAFYFQTEGNYGTEYYFYNGQRPKRSFHPKWFKLDKKPTRVEKETPLTRVNYRYELIDNSMASDKIKSVLQRSDVEYDDGDYWKDEYAHLQRLYAN
jgi:hypothetical protein